MIEMTIRLDNEATTAIEELKALFNEKTANKSIVAAVKNYAHLQKAYEREKSEKLKIVTKLAYVKEAYSKRQEYDALLRDHLE